MCIELGLIRRVYPTDKQTNILILLIYIESNYILTDKYSCDDDEDNDDIDETHSINSIHKSLNL